MLTVTTVRGKYYKSHTIEGIIHYSDEYYKFDWETGYMIIQKKKNLVLMKGLEE